MAILKLNNVPTYKKYTIRDTEHLIEELKSCMPLSKEMAIYNINKYGYSIEQEYILQSLGFSINKKNKIRVNKNIQIQAEIFSIMFNTNRECYIRLRNKQTGEYRAYPILALQDPYRLQAILKSKYFSNNEDMMYSLNAYNNMYKCNNEALFSLQNCALDIDFNIEQYTIKQVINIIKKMYVDGIIPVPNIIEYGNRLRIIYSIEDVPATTKSKSLLNKIIQAINSKIPKELGSSGQALTTFGRINGSINSKNNSKVKVEVINPNKYKLRDLQEGVLEQPEWFKKVKKANSKVVSIKNCYTLNLARLRDLEKIQKIRQYGYRELLCYLYRNYCLLANISEEETWEKLRIFNNNFTEPLRENVLDGDTKHLNRKQYLHKNKTILALLDIESKEEVELRLESILSEEESKRRDNISNKKRYRAKMGKDINKSKQDEIEEIRTKIKSLRKEGFKNKDISKELSLPTKTLERHITYLKKKGLL